MQTLLCVLQWVSITSSSGVIGSDTLEGIAFRLKGQSFAVNIYRKQIGMYWGLYTVLVEITPHMCILNVGVSGGIQRDNVEGDSWTAVKL